MYKNKIKNILISNVNPSEEGYFIPLIHANLKSYCEQFQDIAQNYNWLSPLFMPIQLYDLAKHYELASIDILGISCYQWNYTYQYNLAKFIKEINPSCMIVAGGPQVDFKNIQFFNLHPYIDFIVPYEGEIPFQNILSTLIKTPFDLSSITGTIINPKHGEYKFKKSEKINLETRPSPWLSQKEFWLDFFQKNNLSRLATSFESARGCPYFCTFCDWGSDTSSNLRLVKTETARQEIDFILQNLNPIFIFWTDSNLGMVDRDLELVKHFAENKKKSGFPKHLYYSNNKNSYEKTLAIAKQFRSVDLLSKFTLSIQHTDADVLKAIRRKNLPSEEIPKLINELKNIDYPIFLQFIIGCPGDSFDKWLINFTNMMENGLHSEYRVYLFNLLPNAPASDSTYLKNWEIETVERFDFIPYYTTQDRAAPNWSLSKSKYIVGSKTFSQSDYKKMQLLTWLIQACHDHGFTRMIAIAAREVYGISYHYFYHKLFNWFYSSPALKELPQFYINHIDMWLSDDNSNLLIEESSTKYFIEPPEKLVFDLFKNFDLFFDTLEKEFLVEFDLPNDLINYQKNILFKPSSKFEDTNFVILSERWYLFFNKNLRNIKTNNTETIIYNQFEVDKSALKFSDPLWLEIKNPLTRNRLFLIQIIQHNIPNSDRAAFIRPSSPVFSSNSKNGRLDLGDSN